MKLEVELSEALAGAVTRRCVKQRKTYGEVINELLLRGLGTDAPKPAMQIIVVADTSKPMSPALAVRAEAERRVELKRELCIKSMYAALEAMGVGRMRKFEALLTSTQQLHLSGKQRAAWRRALLNRVWKSPNYQVVSDTDDPNPIIQRLS